MIYRVIREADVLMTVCIGTEIQTALTMALGLGKVYPLCKTRGRIKQNLDLVGILIPLAQSHI
ncbi:hypothetical protein SK128_002124, partial [Halocaridina rubra]